VMSIGKSKVYTRPCKSIKSEKLKIFIATLYYT
jgi:hypothetical protein